MYKKLLMLICISASSAAFAQMSVPFGWYVEPNIGTTRVEDTFYSGSTSTSGLGFNFNAGYKFMPFFAMEIGYTRYSKITVKYNGATAATDKHYMYDFAIKGIFPLNTSGFEAFGKLGIQRLNSKIGIVDATAASNVGITESNSVTSTGYLLGAGGQYFYTPEMPIIFQWTRAKGSSRTGTLDFWSLGIAYLFN